MSIPKVIHYCWFGRGELPRLAEKCIQSWKKYCSDYEIVCWNEDNFDINQNKYAREAYEAGVDTLEEYKQNKLKIQARIDELTNQIKEAESNSPEEISMAISERIQSGLKILESTETSETIKNMTLRTFIDKIVYFKAKNIIEIFYKL